ncbi:GntR family transcriptional regulator [Microbacterium sp.]|uniref:GntR family transcriptional regulator n=1 Tax=Microbacterium sp. TaxID=51671 RepID=UPI00334152A4
MAGEKPGELESDRVTRTLRDDILSGRRAPGSRLIERDIAAELDVSRLPVREAIRRLVAEGVVVSRPRTWATVRVFTTDDVQQLGELREAIESLMFELATVRADAEGLALVRAALEQEERAAAAGDLEAAHLAADAFHTAAVTMAGNEMLVEAMRVFSTRLRMLFAQHSDAGGMLDEHREIYLAMEAGDVERVRSLVTPHLFAGRASAEERVRRLATG